MHIVVRPFARIREIIGAASLERAQPAGACAGDLWNALAREFPALAPLAGSTRLLHNGSLANARTPLADGDEVALLPPFGGG